MDDEFRQAVNAHAEYLGMDPERDQDLLWIAEEALNAELPEGWHMEEGEDGGEPYYWHDDQEDTTWEHPLDNYYISLYQKEKARKEKQGGQSDRRHSRDRDGDRRPRSEEDYYEEDQDWDKDRGRRHDDRYEETDPYNQGAYDDQGRYAEEEYGEDTYGTQRKGRGQRDEGDPYKESRGGKGRPGDGDSYEGRRGGGEYDEDSYYKDQRGDRDDRYDARYDDEYYDDRYPNHSGKDKGRAEDDDYYEDQGEDEDRYHSRKKTQDRQDDSDDRRHWGDDQHHDGSDSQSQLSYTINIGGGGDQGRENNRHTSVEEAPVQVKKASEPAAPTQIAGFGMGADMFLDDEVSPVPQQQGNEVQDMVEEVTEMESLDFDVVDDVKSTAFQSRPPQADMVGDPNKQNRAPESAKNAMAGAPNKQNRAPESAKNPNQFFPMNFDDDDLHSPGRPQEDPDDWLDAGDRGTQKDDRTQEELTEERMTNYTTDDWEDETEKSAKRGARSSEDLREHNHSPKGYRDEWEGMRGTSPKDQLDQRMNISRKTLDQSTRKGLAHNQQEMDHGWDVLEDKGPRHSMGRDSDWLEARQGAEMEKEARKQGNDDWADAGRNQGTDDWADAGRSKKKDDWEEARNRRNDDWQQPQRRKKNDDWEEPGRSKSQDDCEEAGRTALAEDSLEEEEQQPRSTSLSASRKPKNRSRSPDASRAQRNRSHSPEARHSPERSARPEVPAGDGSENRQLNFTEGVNVVGVQQLADSAKENAYLVTKLQSMEEKVRSQEIELNQYRELENLSKKKEIEAKKLEMINQDHKEAMDLIDETKKKLDEEKSSKKEIIKAKTALEEQLKEMKQQHENEIKSLSERADEKSNEDSVKAQESIEKIQKQLNERDQNLQELEEALKKALEDLEAERTSKVEPEAISTMKTQLLEKDALIDQSKVDVASVTKLKEDKEKENSKLMEEAMQLTLQVSSVSENYRNASAEVLALSAELDALRQKDASSVSGLKQASSEILAQQEANRKLKADLLGLEKAHAEVQGELLRLKTTEGYGADKLRRAQVELANERSANEAERRIQRQKIEELQAKIKALERQLESTESLHVQKYHELELDKDAIDYELKRTVEKLQKAEEWRVKEATRAAKAEKDLEVALLEISDLKNKIARHADAVENAVVPLRRDKSRLEDSLKEQEIKIDLLIKEKEHQKKQAEIEYLQLKTEIEARIPEITGAAVQKTEEEWHKRLEVQTQQIQAQAQSRIDELLGLVASLKSALVETQAKSHSQMSVEKAQREALETHMQSVIGGLEASKKELQEELEESKKLQGQRVAQQTMSATWEEALQDSALTAIQSQVSSLQLTCRQLISLDSVQPPNMNQTVDSQMQQSDLLFGGKSMEVSVGNKPEDLMMDEDLFNSPPLPPQNDNLSLERSKVSLEISKRLSFLNETSNSNILNPSTSSMEYSTLTEQSSVNPYSIYSEQKEDSSNFASGSEPPFATGYHQGYWKSKYIKR